LYESLSKIKTAKSKQENRKFLLAKVLIGVFLFIDITLGMYHITHGGGWVSGSVEMLIACTIVFLSHKVYQTRLSNNPKNDGRQYSVVLMGTLAVIAITLLVLSIYHFSHNGVTSGITELLLSVILTTAGLMVASLI
jgi:heme A synthase